MMFLEDGKHEITEYVKKDMSVYHTSCKIVAVVLRVVCNKNKLLFS